MPDAIRTDNAVPFASAHALNALRKLAVWWLRLGIRLERITPGFHDWTAVITTCRSDLLLASENQREPGVRRPECRGKQVDDHIWLVTFMHYELGYFDDETCRLEPTLTHSARTVTHVSGMKCYRCLWNRP